MRRTLTILTAALVAVLALAGPSLAQQYPPDEGPVDVLPTVIDREEPPAPAPAAPDAEVASDDLPRTGVDAGVLAGIAAGAVVVGSGALVAARRRKTPTA